MTLKGADMDAPADLDDMREEWQRLIDEVREMTRQLKALNVQLATDLNAALKGEPQ